MKPKYLLINKVNQKLTETGASILSIRDFANLFNLPKRKASLYLINHSGTDNLFTRISRGYYINNKFPPLSFEIANAIYRPSYISLETALSYYKVIPDVVYTTTSITTKHSKKTEILNQEFQYQKIGKQHFFGYQPIKIGEKNVLIANREKAVLDYLYFVATGHKALYDRINLKEINWIKFRIMQKTMVKNIKNIFVRKRMLELIKRIQ